MSDLFIPILVVIEPDKSVSAPYHFIRASQIKRFTALNTGLAFIQTTRPTVIAMSASFPAADQMAFFESLTKLMTDKLFPILMVVNAKTALSTILGTSWGGRLGVISSTANYNELNSTLSRIVT